MKVFAIFTSHGKCYKLIIDIFRNGKIQLRNLFYYNFFRMYHS